MDYSAEYSKYSLDTLYAMLSRIDTKKNPDRTNGLVKAIANLEGESYPLNGEGGNVKNLKIALLRSKERNSASQDISPVLRLVHWTYYDILIGILTLVSLHAIGIALGHIGGIGYSIKVTIGIFAVFILVNTVAQVVVPFYICYRKKAWPFLQNLSFTTYIKEIFRAIGYYFLTVISVGILMYLMEIVLGTSVEPPKVLEWTDRAPRNVYLILFLTFGFLITPVVEEIFFRGFLYNALKQHLPIMIAAITQAAIFAIVHPYDIMNRIQIFLFGIFLVVFYERRKNLLTPITMHSLLNFSWALKILLK